MHLMEHLFLGNKLIENQFPVGEEVVDLRRILCPVDIVSGEKDRITPREYSQALRRHVPQATMHVVPGAGHIGTFIGEYANNVTLPAICQRFA